MFRTRTDALAFLGLPPGASDANAKKAYRKMALRLHPNKPSGSHEEFQRLEDAFEMFRNRNKWQPVNGPIPESERRPQPRPQPRPEDPRPQRPTVRVTVTGVPGPLENTSRDLVFLPGQAPTLAMVLDRVQQELPAFAEYLKNGLHAHRATLYINGSMVKESITEHGARAPLLGSGLSSTTVFLLLEARKPRQATTGWMFLGESANAYRRRSAAEAEERKKKRNAKRNAEAAKASAGAGPGGEYEVRVWTIKNMASTGPSRFPFAIKKMTFASSPTVLKVVERIAGGSDMIRRMAEKGYLAYDKPYTWRPSNSKYDPIKDVRKTLAPMSFHLVVRDREDKNTYGLPWKKLAFDADAEARARARERFGANANSANAGANSSTNSENARARANAEAANAAARARANANAAAKARANAEAAAAAKARADANAAKARANANAAAAKARANANATAAAAAAKARANAEAAAAAKARADANAAKARANANAAAARARADANAAAKAHAAAARANARAKADAKARNRATNEANARARANANIIEVDFWDGVSVRPTSGARFSFPAGTRPTIGMVVQRIAAEPEFFEFLKDGFRVIKFSKAWHPKYKGKGFDALLGPENNAAANVSRRVIVLARQPKQRKEGWMYLPGSTPKPTKKKASRGPTPPPGSRRPSPPGSRGPSPPRRGPMSNNAAARVIQRFARRRVLPMKNAEGKFFTGFENKKPISRKYMIAIDGKLYDARNIMREVDQKYDDPHAIAMQELFDSLPLEQKIAVRRRAGNYRRIFQNSNGDPQKYVDDLKKMGLPLDQVHYRQGDASLHYAVMTSRVPLVRALLEGGANPNIKMEGRNNDKQTPLHLAVKEVHVPSKRLEIVNLLLQYGANPNVVDKGPYKQTPLDIAAFDARDADVVRSLLAAGAKLRHYSLPEDRRLMTAPVQKAFENAGF